MSFLHKENLNEARTLLNRIRNNEDVTEDFIRATFNKMGFDISDEDNNVNLLLAFSLGALANEPDDSDWLKIVK